MDQHNDSITGETKLNAKSDQAFKCLITDKDILSALLGGIVPEFKGLKKEKG